MIRFPPAVLALALASALIVPGQRLARADGAFPDSIRLFLPAERPATLVLATNFGIVTSDDAGQTWAWACEQPESANADSYQLGPAPAFRLFGIAAAAPIYSDDRGCSWRAAPLNVADARVLDVFPDPAAAERVFVNVAVGPVVDQVSVLLASSDGGATYARELLRPAPPAILLGVESARSRPATIYATFRQGPGTHPRVARSDDGGENWSVFDVEVTTGPFDVKIIAVHPTDPATVYFRVQAFPDEFLAITADGGETVRVAARIDRGVLTAFARRADGTLLLAGENASGGVVQSSGDDGATWTPWVKAPIARDFAERGGILHVVGDDARDQFTIAVSSGGVEDGTGLRKLMRFSDVAAIRACAFATCGAACAFEVTRDNLPAAACATSLPSDAGSGPGIQDGAAPGQDASPVDAGVADLGADGVVVASSNGCACALSHHDVGSWPWLFAFLVAALAIRARPRFRDRKNVLR